MITKNGEPIVTLDQWRQVAGPKHDTQWKEGRSALETARCWLDAGGALPTEIAQILASHAVFGEVRSWSAEPEVRLPFDEFRGEPRNADMLVHARDDHGDLLLAIESKADETFGELVGEAMANALDRKLQNPRSNGIARVEQLAAALFGSGEGGERLPALAVLRYQLLTATAGAIRAAELRSIARVVMLVHEFVTRETKPKKRQSNLRDLERFLSRITKGEARSLETGRLYGPISIPGLPLFQSVPDLYIGKVSRSA